MVVDLSFASSPQEVEQSLKSAKNKMLQQRQKGGGGGYQQNKGKFINTSPSQAAQALTANKTIDEEVKIEQKDIDNYFTQSEGLVNNSQNVQITRTAGEVDVLNTPFIAADVDLNNDGQIKTIIKHAFMGCYIPDPRCDNGQTDVLSIFRKSDIDLMTGPIEWNAVFKGQNGHTPLAVIFGEYSSCELMRPFVYAGVTYLSCYHQEWVKDYLDFRNNTPDKEYTDILKYQGVKDMGDGRKQIKAETVCRFRMKVTQ